MSDLAPNILLATINAKWIHPSLALRLLKANLGLLENNCAIIEFALRQPPWEKIEPILAARPRILGLSVSIWNHTATLDLLKELRKAWVAQPSEPTPVIVLGGPEVSHLPPEAEIFQYADYCIMGEGEIAFRELCETILGDKVFAETGKNSPCKQVFAPQSKNLTSIKTAYHLYTDEDLHKKLIYVEASRGCPFGCEFCLSAKSPAIREFPLEPFLAEMSELLQGGARTFKFLDRSFNLNIDRARRIMEFFLDKLADESQPPFVVHFEMVPSRFPAELTETLARFPSGSLRLEIGIQTFNREVSARIGRSLEPERELENLRLLREKTSAIIHADLIAGLPGEDMVSFGRGFDLLWAALFSEYHSAAEIQLGILKLLPGALIARHTGAFGMCYSPSPPYEVMETAAMPAADLARIKNFARFWELIVNRGLAVHGTAFGVGPAPVFERFMALSDSLLSRFGRNWGIPKNELQEAIQCERF